MRYNFSGKRELYLEIADKYESYITLGVLKVGDKLPSIRSAATEFGVNPNTMAHAYSALEDRGLIQSIPKKGIYVTAKGSEDAKADPISEECMRLLAANKELLFTLKEKGIKKQVLSAQLEEVFSENDQN